MYVGRLWHLRDAPAHSHEIIVPSGTIELVFNLHEDELRIYRPGVRERFRRFSGAVVSGAYATAFATDTRQHASIMGVHFRTGGAFPFLRVEAHELASTHVDLENLWGTGGRTLRDRLGEAATPEARFRLLEYALVQRLRGASEPHPAVRAALAVLARPEGSGPVRDIVRDLGVSHRRFIRLFSREVGMPPKLFRRVQRFQRALELARQTPAPNWAQLAVECGCFDQSHLIREFLDFASLTPTDCHRRRNSRVMPNHMPLCGDG